MLRGLRVRSGLLLALITALYLDLVLFLMNMIWSDRFRLIYMRARRAKNRAVKN